VSRDPPPDSVPSPAATTARKVWRVGTLTYTTGGLVVLFFWLLWGDFGFYLKERAVPPALQLLLARFHVSDLVVGLLLASLPQVIAVLIGPVIGYHSDRHRGRWGRRIPFLLVPTPFAFLAMVSLAFSPELGRMLHAALGRWSPGEGNAIVLALAGSWTLFELSAIVCNGVFFSLIADVVPREVIGRFFALFRIVSLSAGMVFNYYLFGAVEEHYVAVFLGIGAIYGVSFTLMCLKVKEGRYPPPPPPDPATLARATSWRVIAGVRTYCRDCFVLPYYRWVFLSFALSTLALVPLNLFSIFYAKSLGMSMSTLGKYGALQLFLSLLQAYPAGWLADRIHPLRLTLVALVLLVASTMAAFFLVHDIATFAAAYVIVGTLAGFWATSVASLPAVIFPQRKFATMDSAKSVITALGTMLIGPISGWSLDRMGHDYRYMYLWSSLGEILALSATVLVYRRFVTFGGPRHYVAPDVDALAAPRPAIPT
jgi:MFS family permease